MAKQFNIDDAFSLEGEEEGAGPEEDLDGWKDRERERDGEMTFGPLTFSKPQSLPSSSTGTMDHSNLKYQVRIRSQLLFRYIFIFITFFICWKFTSMFKSFGLSVCCACRRKLFTCCICWENTFS